ncbi:MAG: hypothetical protein CPDRYMAC_4839 [uncultured Paraburkholderia sp.]|nr:MAG: hypothetical protein CPDRYDRY_4750 [uncultured Paraburkholderia sp.]CAH2938452.1 MAG: hypothetical protein CPDRYMAC_4839 [uncultured Paraburkholderia sp.]
MEDPVVVRDGVVDILVDQSDETTIAKSIHKWLAPKGDLYYCVVKSAGSNVAIWASL